VLSFEFLNGPKVDLLFDAVANSLLNFRYQGRSVGKVGAWDMWDETICAAGTKKKSIRPISKSDFCQHYDPICVNIMTE
jgi:hypothetical protein